MRILIVLSLLLTGCAHTQVKEKPRLEMGGVSQIPCGTDNCGKLARWDVL